MRPPLFQKSIVGQEESSVIFLLYCLHRKFKNIIFSQQKTYPILLLWCLNFDQSTMRKEKGIILSRLFFEHVYVYAGLVLFFLAARLPPFLHNHHHDHPSCLPVETTAERRKKRMEKCLKEHLK